MNLTHIPLTQTAIAASVDLRCYGLATPRNDGKLSVHFTDIDNFYHEWDVDSLPWEAVTPIALGEEPPEVLNEKLVDALNKGPLGHLDDTQSASRGAGLAFLYLYMTLSNVQDQYVLCSFRGEM